MLTLSYCVSDNILLLQHHKHGVRRESMKVKKKSISGWSIRLEDLFLAEPTNITGLFCGCLVPCCAREAWPIQFCCFTVLVWSINGNMLAIM